MPDKHKDQIQHKYEFTEDLIHSDNYLKKCKSITHKSIAFSFFILIGAVGLDSVLDIKTKDSPSVNTAKGVEALELYDTSGIKPSKASKASPATRTPDKDMDEKLPDPKLDEPKEKETKPAPNQDTYAEAKKKAEKKEPEQKKKEEKKQERKPEKKKEEPKKDAKVSDHDSNATQASKAVTGRNATKRKHGVKKKGQVTSKSTPVYPLESREKGEEGTVVCTAWLDKHGKLKKVAIHKSSGFKLLDDSALDFFRKATFSPAKNFLGEPVASHRHFKLNFKLEN